MRNTSIPTPGFSKTSSELKPKTDLTMKRKINLTKPVRVSSAGGLGTTLGSNGNEL